uniref:Uncharacterized protein n=1 Tax=Glossina austeni TaxID=7395 RepID=A0A1A9VPB5_GLOAU
MIFCLYRNLSMSNFDFFESGSGLVFGTPLAILTLRLGLAGECFGSHNGSHLKSNVQCTTELHKNLILRRQIIKFSTDLCFVIYLTDKKIVSTVYRALRKLERVPIRTPFSTYLWDAKVLGYELAAKTMTKVIRRERIFQESVRLAAEDYLGFEQGVLDKKIPITDETILEVMDSICAGEAVTDETDAPRAPEPIEANDVSSRN